MLSVASKHVLDVLFCVIGILSGLSGGVSFGTLFSNEPAMMWAYYSGCLAYACLVIEMLRYHGMLQVCCTPASLWVVSLYAVLSLATTSILFLVHLSVGLRNRESVAGKSALDHSDFIVAVWTFFSAKFCLKLYFVSKKSRQALQRLSILRAESPDFEAMRRHEPLAESVNSHAHERRPRLEPDDDSWRRSSSDRRRRARRSGRRQRRLTDRSDLLSDVSYIPTPSQLAAATDSESAGDMEEEAQTMTLTL